MGTTTTGTDRYDNRVNGPGSCAVRREWRKQTKPIDRTMILPYLLIRAACHSGKVTGKITYWSPNREGYGGDFNVVNGGSCVCSLGTYRDGPGMPRTRQIERAVNLAREKFTGKLQEQALTAVNYHERQQAMSMMARRLDFLETTFRQICRLARSSAWRRGEIVNLQIALSQGLAASRNFRGSASKVAKTMIQKIKDWRGSGRSLGNLWLELHFGWEPMMKDIYAAYELFASPPEPVFLKGKSPELFIEESLRYTYGTIRGVWHGSTFEPKTRTRAYVFGLAEVSDPNLYKTQRLGLTNPGLFLWEIVPFSFVIDWFANVSQWLSQWDEFLGIKLTNVGYAVKVTQTAKGSWTELSGKATAHSSLIYFQRFDTFPQVKLGLRPLKALSAVRAATAISLLLQLLKNPTVSQKQPLRSKANA